MLNPAFGQVVTLAVVALAELMVAQTPGYVPLVVEPPRVSDGRVTVTLLNPGPRTIVGWGVEVLISYADGTSLPLAAMTDGYESIARRDPKSPLIAPGTSHVFVFPTVIPRLEQLRLVSGKATLVIFDDDTASGDERRLERLFAARALNQRAWLSINTLLDSVIDRTADPMSALHYLGSQLDAIEDEEVRKSPAVTEFQRKVSSAWRRGQEDASTASSRLQELRQEAAALRQVAEAHARRRF